MVVRTWRKISAPGRLCQGKPITSNVIMGNKSQSSSSTPDSPETYVSTAITRLPKRSSARKILKESTNSLQMSCPERETSPGKIAIKFLLAEFSSYAHGKIQQALDSVI